MLVLVLLSEFFTFALLHENDVIDDAEEHIFDVVAVGGRSLIKLHLLFLDHISQLLLIVVPA